MNHRERIETAERGHAKAGTGLPKIDAEFLQSVRTVTNNLSALAERDCFTEITQQSMLDMAAAIESVGEAVSAKESGNRLEMSVAANVAATRNQFAQRGITPRQPPYNKGEQNGTTVSLQVEAAIRCLLSNTPAEGSGTETCKEIIQGLQEALTAIGNKADSWVRHNAELGGNPVDNVSVTYPGVAW